MTSDHRSKGHKASPRLANMKRRARLLSRRSGRPLHEELDDLAVKHGQPNWSMLAKACGTTRTSRPLYGFYQPDNPLSPREGSTSIDGGEVARVRDQTCLEGEVVWLPGTTPDMAVPTHPPEGYVPDPTNLLGVNYVGMPPTILAMEVARCVLDERSRSIPVDLLPLVSKGLSEIMRVAEHAAGSDPIGSGNLWSLQSHFIPPMDDGMAVIGGSTSLGLHLDVSRRDIGAPGSFSDVPVTLSVPRTAHARTLLSSPLPMGGMDRIVRHLPVSDAATMPDDRPRLFLVVRKVRAAARGSIFAGMSRPQPVQIVWKALMHRRELCLLNASEDARDLEIACIYEAAAWRDPLPLPSLVRDLVFSSDVAWDKGIVAQAVWRGMKQAKDAEGQIVGSTWQGLWTRALDTAIHAERAAAVDAIGYPVRRYGNGTVTCLAAPDRLDALARDVEAIGLSVPWRMRP